MRVCLIRHGRTGWNEDGRIQGRTDVALSDGGRAQVRSWRLPDGFADAPCTTSPLSRARETAALLGFLEATVDDALTEMAWGRFEGTTLDELRVHSAMADLEAAGLDFRPPGGESPRLVAERLAGFLCTLGGTRRDHLLVTHKGILRASLVLALGWDMLGKPPVRYEPERALVYRLSPAGGLALEAVVPLVPSA